MKHEKVLPDDLYGFTFEEFRKILLRVKRITGVILTNKDMEFDLIKGYRVTGIGQWKIKTSSKKKLNLVMDEIYREMRNRDNPEINCRSVFG